ncbi:CAAX protease self-immunity [Ruminococcaceae bacterium YAD3003]|nr:CAAX protease self-immunity [Ruminococcaceae bacterium YAD3003]
MDKKKVIKFLVITYVISWTIQSAVSLYMVNNPGMTGTTVFQAGMAICMYIPLIAALISKASFREMGWKPRFKGNFGWLVFAAYGMLPVVAAGTAIFFMIFPDLFDAGGSYIMAQYEAAGVNFAAQLEQSGMNYQMYILASLPGFLIAPFINIVTAIGEEAGWRGFLYPELNKKFGKASTWIIGGICWAAFHFPAMLIAGYEYGLNYIGSPWLGLIVFTVFCIAMGVMEEIVYSKTKCIWYAALLHGSINALATLPSMIANANNVNLEKYMILGPAPNGIIAGLPLIILAVFMGVAVIRKDKKSKEAV